MPFYAHIFVYGFYLKYLQAFNIQYIKAKGTQIQKVCQNQKNVMDYLMA